MARSLLHSAPDMVLKIRNRGGDERTIGYCSGFSFTVSQGQKMIYVVDSPFPYEISQGAAPSFVRGTLVFYLPKGMNMESAGIVPYRKDIDGDNFLATSTYSNFMLYDRATEYLIYSIDHAKVGSYTVSIEAKKVVRVTAQFEGILLTPGQVNG